MNTNRTCECCGSGFASGKNYGDYWCEFPAITIETLPDGTKHHVVVLPHGLCEFCNPNCEKWFVPNRKCHKKIHEKIH